MSRKFTHYLITRFNVPVNNWHKDKAGKPVLDHLWMENRLNLFAQYCLPTIVQQSERGFQWLIYCDRQTHPALLKKIKELILLTPQARIIPVTDFEELLTELRGRLSGSETEYVITSRLDNDDGLGPNFISDVQQAFSDQDKLIINFTKGVLYDHSKKVLTEIRNSERNHYGSLIESAGQKEFVTVMGYPHGIPPEGSTELNLHNRFSWLKVIHDRNMISKTNGIPILRKDIGLIFNIDEEFLKISWLHTFWFLIRKVLSRIKRTISFF